MIAVTSSGARFAALARYLLHGRSGTETQRVAWTAGRNLGTDDPVLAAQLMQAVADQNVRVEAPVYHVTISFDPHDPVTHERMEAVADHLLRNLGLAEHQALLVAHQDRAHPHVHIMVNRVHPDTGLAWERWQDRPRIEKTLRGLEQSLGLRQVAGRLYQLEGQAPPGPAPLTNGERRQAERTGEPAFPDRVRAYLPELRAARSWTELDERLHAHGLRLERKGQGLVITDGTHQVKASRVARDLSLRRLEERFGVPYPGREEELARREPLSPDVGQLKSVLEAYERITALDLERTRVGAEHDRLLKRQEALEGSRALVGAPERFDRMLAAVYRDPAAARAAFLALVDRDGLERAAEALAREPERFGPLHTIERTKTLGPSSVDRLDDASLARDRAQAAANVGQWWIQTEQRLQALAGAPGQRGAALESAGDHARAAVKTQLGQLQARLDELQQQLKHAPSLEWLVESMRPILGRLEPRQLAQLRRFVRAPKATIAFQLARAVLDRAVGRDEGQEL